MGNKLTVQVSGYTATGKTTLVALIKSALEGSGLKVKLTGVDEQCDNLDDRIARMYTDEKLRSTTIDLVEVNLGIPKLNVEVDPTKKPTDPRHVVLHNVPGVAPTLSIHALHRPGDVDDNHRYDITGFNTSTNPAEYDGSAHLAYSLIFQNGNPNEVGINGITMESLLAVAGDRLMRLQTGQFACTDNQEALVHIALALGALKRRTEKRIAALTNPGCS